jgi:hypothetical protein
LDGNKLSILLNEKERMIEQLLCVEGTTNKITVLVCSASIIGPLFVLEKLGSLKGAICFWLAGAIAAITTAAILSVKRNKDHAQWIQRQIIRIQVALGYYTDDQYGVPETEENR